MDVKLTLMVNALLSILGCVITFRVIPRFKTMFLRANLYGIDMGKRNSIKIPEAMGVVCGSVFLIIMFLFIPVPFIQYWTTNSEAPFPHHQ
ncbi:UDP-N-acetylglucosamine--dolichyl-phosphate N-acetylglucosaminephosphotransferase, partial [Araneus ventricosus]